MAQRDDSDELDAALALYADELRAFGLLALAALYAQVSVDDIDGTLGPASVAAAALYEAMAAAALSACDEYMALKGAVAGVDLVFDWRRGDPTAPSQLPSGMDVRYFMSRAPAGVKALVAKGMPAADAVATSEGRAARAVGSVAHQEVRDTLARRASGIDGAAMPQDAVDRFVREAERYANESYAAGAGERRTRVRYRRVPSPGACSFCLTLASRGGVYWSKRSATSRRDGQLYHYMCRCRAVLDVEGMPDIVLSREDFRRLTTRDADGNLPVFGIGRNRYTVEDFTYGVDRAVPKPSWSAPSKG